MDLAFNYQRNRPLLCRHASNTLHIEPVSLLLTQ